MKKYLFLIAAALVMGFTSCDSDPSDSSTSAGGTAVKKMCGDWVVTVYTCDNQGDVANIDNWAWEEVGTFSDRLYTYNTSANKSNEMWVDDREECDFGGSENYSHKVKVNVQYGKKTFAITKGENEYGDAVTIVGGKVILNGATVEMDRNQTTKRDSIVYYVNVAGTSMGYLKVAGYRGDF